MLLESIFKTLAYVIPICVSATIVLLKLIKAEKYKIQRDTYKNMLDDWFNEKK